jgi:hypothetical protein
MAKPVTVFYRNINLGGNEKWRNIFKDTVSKV